MDYQKKAFEVEISNGGPRGYLEDGPEWLDEVPAELFGELIERIIIISPERLKFRLLNGMELAENIERTVR